MKQRQQFSASDRQKDENQYSPESMAHYQGPEGLGTDPVDKAPHRTGNQGSHHRRFAIGVVDDVDEDCHEGEASTRNHRGDKGVHG